MATKNLEQWQTLTFILAATLAVIGFDLFMYVYNGQDGTISSVSRKMFRVFPILYVIFIFWLGVLVGHLFPEN